MSVQPVRAVAYYRMSTDLQDDSIKRQRSQVNAYAQRQGIRVVREYLDEGIPGDEVAKRKGFSQMLREAQDPARGWDIILCDDKDRFGRFDAIDYGEIVAPLRRAGVRLVTVAQGVVDWNSLVGRLLDAMLQEFKAEESKATSRRIITKLLMKAKARELTGGPPPYGYDYEYRIVVLNGKEVSKPFRMVPGDPLKVAVVKLIFDLYGNRGRSLKDIQDELRRRAVPNPQGGPVWARCSIRFVLRNRKYVGDWVWNQRHEGKYSECDGQAIKTHDQRTRRRYNDRSRWVIEPDTHEPLIDRELFERVQDRLAKRADRKAPLPRSGDYLFSGLLVCGHCGARMFAQKGYKVCGYYCQTYHRDGKGACNYNGIREDRLLACVVRKLQEVINPDTIAEMEAELLREVEAVALAEPARIRDLQGRIAEIDQEVAQGLRNLRRVPEGVAEELGKALEALRGERDVLTAEVNRLERGTERMNKDRLIEAGRKRLWRISEALQSGDRLQVREILWELISKVEVWFNHTPGARQMKCVFAKGIIWVRTDSEVLTEDGGKSRATSGSSWPSLPPAGSSTFSRGSCSVRSWKSSRRPCSRRRSSNVRSSFVTSGLVPSSLVVPLAALGSA